MAKKKRFPVTIESIRAERPHRLLYRGETLVAADAGILSDEQRTAMKTTRFTAYCVGPARRWPFSGDDGMVEELDVDAVDKASARELFQQILVVDYIPGLKIKKIVAQYGMYF